MGLARHIRGMEAMKQPIIIFCDGYEKYAYDAFDVGGVPVSGKARGRTEICRGVRTGGGQIVSGGGAAEEKLGDPVWRRGKGHTAE